ncbi:NUDIX hydrolase [Bacillus sp. AK031]
MPAGKREEGESCRDCAARELYEETGQVVDSLSFKGIMVKESKDGELRHNPVFTAEIDVLQPFHENEETSQIMLWDMKRPLESIDEVDFILLKWLVKKEFV